MALPVRITKDTTSVDAIQDTLEFIAMKVRENFTNSHMKNSFFLIEIFCCISEINECLSSPCKNSAECKDIVNGYECICPPGFGGDTCNECKYLIFLVFFLYSKVQVII